MTLNSFLLAQPAGDPAAAVAGGGIGMLLVNVLPLALIFVVFYFLLIRPQKKRDKAVQKMRSSVEVGDEIVTAGGVVGRVVSLREDTLVIESGSDRSKIRVMRWAIQSNNTVHDATPSE